MRVTKVYTRTGDDGTTGLGGGQRVSKNSPRIAACGAIDELNAQLGAARAVGVGSALGREIQRVQNELFDLGADLSVLEEDKTRFPTPRIEAFHVEALERAIDRLQEGLEPLKEFILPGGAPPAAALHVARTVCRRAERELVALAQREPISDQALRYLNRLSDLLFVMARRENQDAGRSDVVWVKGASEGRGDPTS